MDRVEFSVATKRLVAERAGYRCSFPTCNKATIGAGINSDEISTTGIAAHIFSAAPNGPRGRGGLTQTEIASPENAIWLCSEHARVVDNNRGVAFTPETLLSFKALQEARNRREVEGLYSPLGWLFRVNLISTPLFRAQQTISLAKLNLIAGRNGTGKTALVEWIAGAFDHQYLRKWQRIDTRTEYQVVFLTPDTVHVDVSFAREQPLRVFLDGQRVPYNPVGLKVIRVTDFHASVHGDVETIAEALSMDEQTILSLFDEVQAFPHGTVRNLQLEFEDGRRFLRCDVSGTKPGLSFGSLSGREQERVVLEFATAAARMSGRWIPTLLILDGCPQILFPGIFDFYRHHLLDPGNQFQTLMCVPQTDLDIDHLHWLGWEILRTSGEPPDVIVSQDLRLEERR
jgi:hypothetical protein